MKIKNKIAAFGVSLALAVGGTAGIANAANTNIYGELNTGGVPVLYDRTRIHQSNGSISLSVFDMPYGPLELSLRDMTRKGGPQFTIALKWTGKTRKYWSNIPKGKKFAFKGRMIKAPGKDRWWAGSLTY